MAKIEVKPKELLAELDMVLSEDYGVGIDLSKHPEISKLIEELKKPHDSLDVLMDELSFVLQYADQIGIPNALEKVESQVWRNIKKTGVPFWDACKALKELKP